MLEVRNEGGQPLLTVRDGTGVRDALRQFEEAMIRISIHRNEGIIPAAAKDLAIPTSTLYAKIREHRLQGEASAAREAAKELT